MHKNRVSLKLSPFVLIFLTFCSLNSKMGWAKDLEGRVGIGYNSEFANSYANGFRVPGISVKYTLSRDLALEGIIGVATTSPSNSVTAGKIFRNVYFETNVNFYVMGGFGVINSNSLAGVEFLAGVGVEFFLPGIESLGFAMETGATFDNGSGGYAIKTLGVSFLDAGIHFYF
ncbi:MAG: hypothetical protein ABIQ95_08925 [Bdellovibrionia bacterium]